MIGQLATDLYICGCQHSIWEEFCQLDRIKLGRLYKLTMFRAFDGLYNIYAICLVTSGTVDKWHCKRGTDGWLATLDK